MLEFGGPLYSEREPPYKYTSGGAEDIMAGRSRQLVDGLAEALARTPTINDHSHVIAEAERLQRDLDALAYFAHPYPAADLQSAGMSADDLAFVTTPEGRLEARWERFEPY